MLLKIIPYFVNRNYLQWSKLQLKILFIYSILSLDSAGFNFTPFIIVILLISFQKFLENDLGIDPIVRVCLTVQNV